MPTLLVDGAMAGGGGGVSVLTMALGALAGVLTGVLEGVLRSFLAARGDLALDLGEGREERFLRADLGGEGGGVASPSEGEDGEEAAEWGRLREGVDATAPFSFFFSSCDSSLYRDRSTGNRHLQYLSTSNKYIKTCTTNFKVDQKLNFIKI